MIAAAQAGPLPIHNKSLNENNLAEAIRYSLTPQALNAAGIISQKMRMETGVKTAANSFYANLPVGAMMCDCLSEEPAVWVYVKSKKNIKLSDKAAYILTEHKKIDAKHLHL